MELKKPEPQAARRRLKVVCPHDCPDTCVMTVDVEGDGGGAHRRALVGQHGLALEGLGIEGDDLESEGAGALLDALAAQHVDERSRVRRHE